MKDRRRAPEVRARQGWCRWWRRFPQLIAATGIRGRVAIANLCVGQTMLEEAAQSRAALILVEFYWEFVEQDVTTWHERGGSSPSSMRSNTVRGSHGPDAGARRSGGDRIRVQRHSQRPRPPLHGYRRHVHAGLRQSGASPRRALQRSAQSRTRDPSRDGPTSARGRAREPQGARPVVQAEKPLAFPTAPSSITAGRGEGGEMFAHRSAVAGYSSMSERRTCLPGGLPSAFAYVWHGARIGVFASVLVPVPAAAQIDGAAADASADAAAIDDAPSEREGSDDAPPADVRDAEDRAESSARDGPPDPRCTTLSAQKQACEGMFSCRYTFACCGGVCCSTLFECKDGLFEMTGSDLGCLDLCEGRGGSGGGGFPSGSGGAPMGGRGGVAGGGPDVQPDEGNGGCSCGFVAARGDSNGVAVSGVLLLVVVGCARRKRSNESTSGVERAYKCSWIPPKEQSTTSCGRPGCPGSVVCSRCVTPGLRRTELRRSRSGCDRLSFNRSSVPLLVAAVAFAALWLLLRGAPRSPRFVRAVELSTLFVGTAAFSTDGAGHGPDRVAGHDRAHARSRTCCSCMRSTSRPPRGTRWWSPR